MGHLDDYSWNTYTWYTGAVENDYWQGQWEVVGGKYRIELTALQDFATWEYMTAMNLGDFALSVDIEMIETSDAAEGGMTGCRKLVQVGAGCPRNSQPSSRCKMRSRLYPAEWRIDPQGDTPMITLNIFITVKPGGREELLEALRVLFEELAKEPTFLDAWLSTTEEEPDLIVVYERWNETRESFVQNLLPKPYYKPYLAAYERLGLERQVHWLEERHAWRA